MTHHPAGNPLGSPAVRSARIRGLHHRPDEESGLDRTTQTLDGTQRLEFGPRGEPAPRPLAVWLLTALLVVAVQVHLMRSVVRPLSEIYASSPGFIWLYVSFMPPVLLILAAHARLVAPPFYWVFDRRSAAPADGRPMPGVLALGWTAFFTAQCVVQAIWAAAGWALPSSLRLGLAELAGFAAMQIVVAPAIETVLLVAALTLASRLLPNRSMLACFVIAASSAALHGLAHPLSAVPGFIVFFVCGRILAARTDREMTRATLWWRAFVVHAINNAFAVILILTR